MTSLRPACKPIYSPFSDYDTAAAWVRNALGMSRLSPARAADVRAAVARREERVARRSTQDPLADTMIRLRAKLAAEVTAAVSDLMDDLFRGARSSWAGGETEDRVTISSHPHAAGTTSKVWSSNGKWSGNDLTRTVHVMPAWRRRVRDRGIAVLDGMLTTHAELVRDIDGIEVYRATWVRQGRGYDLVAESGHVAYHRPSGTSFHSTRSDPAQAVRGLRRKLKAQAIPQGERDAARIERGRKATERRARQLSRLVERVSRWDLADIEHVVVTRQDSLRAGNCEPGTDAFIERHFPAHDPDGGVTIGEIARAVGRLDPGNLSAADALLAKQLGVACLVAIRRDRHARRTIGV